MSRIFLSHSSADELEAVALQQWMAANGWDDVFLDIDPLRGLAAGERWQEALRRAADRCEAVVFIVTPAWAESKWCQAEFLLAKSLNKRIFGAILKPVQISELPTELTSEWQLCYLVGEGPQLPLTFNLRGQAHQIEFLAEGLDRLRIGLEKAGLDARYFPWPPPDDPQRAPYRGLVTLEEKDAAIYFGRDAQIIRGLDALRGMRATGVENLFVILGPSGTGKSSFLRAGLLPRLKRDDRHFLPLEVVRPERHPITGERGLAIAIHKMRLALGLTGTTLGAIENALMNDAGSLTLLLNEIQQAAVDSRDVDVPPPTLLLSVDQAEELFNADATDEASHFLAIIGAALSDVRSDRPFMIVAFTIRSDRYGSLQTAPALASLKSRVFDELKPMPPQQFKDIITGPARRATTAGHRLRVKADLVDRLLSDCAEGADTLPLLSLVLARLYRNYGSDGDLRLDEYVAMGGMRGVINDVIESLLAQNPTERQAQLEILRVAFIPWLATINPQNDEPMRRVARYSDLPPESHKFIDALAEKGLLLTDRREGVKVVEVAHEALLRLWDVLVNWLRAEREDLKLADALERVAQDWEKNNRKNPWLMVGERLSIAEALAVKPPFQKRLNSCLEFLLASRQHEAQLQAEEERSRQAQLVAAQEKQATAEALAAEQLRATERAQAYASRLKKLGLLIGLVLLVAVGFGISAKLASETAKKAKLRAEELLGFLIGEQFLGEIRDVGRSTLLEQVRDKVQWYTNDGGQDSALIRGLALRNAGDIQHKRGFIADSIEDFEKALMLIDASPDTVDRTREIARTHGLLGDALSAQGHVTQALEHYQTAVKNWHKVINRAEIKAEDCTNLVNSLVVTGELNNRMGERSLALKNLQEALEIATTVMLGSQTLSKGCGSLMRKADPYPDGKLLEVFSRALLLRGVIFNDQRDYKAAKQLAREAKRLSPVSASATIQHATALAFAANSNTLDKSHHSLNEYREVLAEFDEMRRRDPSNRMWEREYAAVQLLIVEEIVACHQHKTKDCKLVPSLEEAGIKSAEVIGTLLNLAQVDSKNTSLRRDLGWAWQSHAQLLAEQKQGAESLEALKKAESFYASSILDRRLDVEGVGSHGAILLAQARALSGLDRRQEAKATLRRSIDMLEELASNHKEDLYTAGHLMDASMAQNKLLQELGDIKGAELADQVRKRLENQSNAFAKKIELEADKFYSLYSANMNQATPLVSEGKLNAALAGFQAAEAAIREYIRHEPSNPDGYTELSNIYNWIQQTQETNKNDDARVAAFISRLRTAQIAALLTAEDTEGPMYKDILKTLADARQSLGIFLNDKERFIEALAMVQEEVLVAEALVQQLALDPAQPGDPSHADYLWRLGTAKFGLGMVRRNLNRQGWEEAISSAIYYLQKAADMDSKNIAYPKKLKEYRQYLIGERVAEYENHRTRRRDGHDPQQNNLSSGLFN